MKRLWRKFVPLAVRWMQPWNGLNSLRGMAVMAHPTLEAGQVKRCLSVASGLAHLIFRSRLNGYRRRGQDLEPLWLREMLFFNEETSRVNTVLAHTLPIPRPCLSKEISVNSISEQNQPGKEANSNSLSRKEVWGLAACRSWRSCERALRRSSAEHTENMAKRIWNLQTLYSTEF